MTSSGPGSSRLEEREHLRDLRRATRVRELNVDPVQGDGDAGCGADVVCGAEQVERLLERLASGVVAADLRRRLRRSGRGCGADRGGRVG